MNQTVETTNNTIQEKEIGSKVKAIFEADWIHVYVGENTTQFVINWDNSTMKTLDRYMMRKIEEITGRKFDIMGIHSSKCLSMIFS